MFQIDLAKVSIYNLLSTTITLCPCLSNTIFVFLRTVALQGVPRSEKTLLVRSVKMVSVRFPGPKISFMRSRKVSCLSIAGPAIGSFVI